MTKVFTSRLAVFSLAFLVLASCSKYEEGNASLASKKSRLVNHWKTLQITSNGYDITSLNIITDVIIRENFTITVNGAFLGIITSADGGWKFDSDKTHVLVTNGDGSLDSYEIVMLEKDEAKFRRTDGDGNLIVYHFVSY